ncbi:MAG: ABC transporter permease, partial [Verrucomicrobia bacterium]|nr:ABC transporter permease [Verrucomicrobiota bacterium]
MGTIFRKELADHFSSTRFLITFALILMVAVVTTFIAGSHLRQALEGVAKPSHVFLLLFTTAGQFFSLVQFIAFFGPLIGILLGFDAINRERNDNTLSKLIAQPIFRDAVINGKFLAGATMIALMLGSVVLLISGLGLVTIGVVPGGDEAGRLLVYLVVSIAYVAFWMGLAILFSILFRSLA